MSYTKVRGEHFQLLNLRAELTDDGAIVEEAQVYLEVFKSHSVRSV